METLAPEPFQGVNNYEKNGFNTLSFIHVDVYNTYRGLHLDPDWIKPFEYESILKGYIVLC